MVLRGQKSSVVVRNFGVHAVAAITWRPSFSQELTNYPASIFSQAICHSLPFQSSTYLQAECCVYAVMIVIAKFTPG